MRKTKPGGREGTTSGLQGWNPHLATKGIVGMSLGRAETFNHLFPLFCVLKKIIIC